jgi:hypothetical protein
MEIIQKFICHYFKKLNKLDLIRYFKSSEFFLTKFINRTKKRIIESICDSIITLCSEEINLVFVEYLHKNIFTLKDAEMFLKAFDSLEEKQSKLYNYIIRFVNTAFLFYCN